MIIRRIVSVELLGMSSDKHHTRIILVTENLTCYDLTHIESSEDIITRLITGLGSFSGINSDGDTPCQ